MNLFHSIPLFFVKKNDVLIQPSILCTNRFISSKNWSVNPSIFLNISCGVFFFLNAAFQCCCNPQSSFLSTREFTTRMTCTLLKRCGAAVDVGKPFDDFCCCCLCHIPDQLYTHMFFFVSILCFLVLFQKKDDDDLEKRQGKIRSSFIKYALRSTYFYKYVVKIISASSSWTHG